MIESSTESPVGVRIGIHTSIAGRLEVAGVHAAELGCDAFQIFLPNPRLGYTEPPKEGEAAAFCERRHALQLHPLVIHGNYLINFAACEPVLRACAIHAFQAEVMRAQVLANVADALRQATRSIRFNDLQILLENTSGQDSALGAQLSELAVARRGAIVHTNDE